MRQLLAGVLCLHLASCSAEAEHDAVGDDLVRFLRENPVVADATWRRRGALKCRPEMVNECGPQGCSERPGSTAWQVVNPSTGEYRHCIPSGCDAYPAVVSHSGSWTTLARAENAFMLRLTGSGRDTEAASLGDTVFIHHDYCR